MPGGSKHCGSIPTCTQLCCTPRLLPALAPPAALACPAQTPLQPEKWPDVPATAAARGRYQHGGAACRDMLPSTDSTLRLKGTSLDRVTSCPWSKPVQAAGGCQTSMLAATTRSLQAQACIQSLLSHSQPQLLTLGLNEPSPLHVLTNVVHRLVHYLARQGAEQLVPAAGRAHASGPLQCQQAPRCIKAYRSSCRLAIAAFNSREVL